MPDNTYPDAATVEAVIAKLPALTISHEPEHSARKQARVREVAATLAAARRVEQEQARTRFSRVWLDDDEWWEVQRAEHQYGATISKEGIITDVNSCRPEFLRALAAYVEGLEWGAPEGNENV